MDDVIEEVVELARSRRRREAAAAAMAEALVKGVVWSLHQRPDGVAAGKEKTSGERMSPTSNDDGVLTPEDDCCSTPTRVRRGESEAELVAGEDTAGAEFAVTGTETKVVSAKTL